MVPAAQPWSDLDCLRYNDDACDWSGDDSAKILKSKQTFFKCKTK